MHADCSASVRALRVRCEVGHKSGSSAKRWDTLYEFGRRRDVLTDRCPECARRTWITNSTSFPGGVFGVPSTGLICLRSFQALQSAPTTRAPTRACAYSSGTLTCATATSRRSRGPRATTVRILGLHNDPRLNWKHQSETINSKLSSLSYAQRLKHQLLSFIE